VVVPVETASKSRESKKLSTHLVLGKIRKVNMKKFVKMAEERSSFYVATFLTFQFVGFFTLTKA